MGELFAFECDDGYGNEEENVRVALLGDLGCRVSYVLDHRVYGHETVLIIACCHTVSQSNISLTWFGILTVHSVIQKCLIPFCISFSLSSMSPSMIPSMIPSKIPTSLYYPANHLNITQLRASPGLRADPTYHYTMPTVKRLIRGTDHWTRRSQASEHG